MSAQILALALSLGVLALAGCKSTALDDSYRPITRRLRRLTGLSCRIRRRRLTRRQWFRPGRSVCRPPRRVKRLK